MTRLLFASLAILVMTASAGVAEGHLELHFIDVGHGYAVLIRSPSG